MPPQAFEEMVVDALDALPESAAPVLAQVVVLVEDAPPLDEVAAGTTRLGVFRGTPLTRPGGRVPGSLPGTITLYRLPILGACASPEAVPARVLKVLGHEVGHALGMEEARLRDLGWY